MEMTDLDLTPEDVAMRDMVRQVAARELAPHARSVDEEERFPREAIRAFGKVGLLGILVPEAYGGSGGTMQQYVLAVEEVARVCGSTSASFMTQLNGMLPIILAGTDEQKQRWLPKTCTGELVPGIAITEPNAGSDVASMKTVAVRDGDDYVLNGSKIFITNGGVADYLCVFAKTDPSARHGGISLFVVERGAKGFTSGAPLKKMGIRGSNLAELFFSDVRVPAANRLGGEGIGFGIAMGALGDARIGTAAQAVGLAQGAYDIAFRYAQERKQFGQVIYDFQAVQMSLMDMYMAVVSARLMTYQLARMIDRKARSEYALEAAMAKVHCSDIAMKVTTDAVQLLGGYGYMREYEAERFMRDAKITQIYDGTNVINRLIMARRLLKRSKN